jgi:hypothetical protein
MIRYPDLFDAAPPAGFDGVFMWDFLKGAFGPVIDPMDFDAVVERCNRFLVFETKHPGAVVPTGQRRALEALVLDPRFTVIVVKAKVPEDITHWFVMTQHAIERIDGDCNALRDWCASWYQRVNETTDGLF